MSHSDTPWTHAICLSCWTAREPGMEPVKIREEFVEAETCCFCGNTTKHGIYVRDDISNASFCTYKESDDKEEKTA